MTVTVSDIKALLAEDHLKYHSAFQISQFILVKSGITEYGMYKQCLREVQTRLEGLREGFLDLEETEIEITENCPSMGNDIDRRKKKVARARAELRREGAMFRLKEIARELAQFSAHALALKSRLGEVALERDQLEAEYWEAQTMFRAGVEFMAHGGVSRDTIEMILAMPEPLKGKMLRATEPGRRKDVIAFCQTVNTNLVLPDVPALSVAEARELIDDASNRVRSDRAT